MNFSEHRLTDWAWQELYRAQLGRTPITSISTLFGWLSTDYKKTSITI